MDDVWLVSCNTPDLATANILATLLVEAGAAACVTIMPAGESIYRWKGVTERASEFPLMIKTTKAKYPAVESLIRENHPYEVPEIIALPVSAGLPAYLDWVRHDSAR